MVLHKIASMMGLRDPTAKGAIVKGIRAADASLNHDGQRTVRDDGEQNLPLESPVIAAMRRGWFWYEHWIIRWKYY